MEADELLGQLIEGSILEGPHWTEPVKVLTAKGRGSRMEVHAVGLLTKRLWEKLLTTETEAHLRTYGGDTDALTSVTRAPRAKG
jgi:hypothetical protein